MEFTEAIEIIKNIVPESSANEYDGIMVKRLEASNTLDEGRTTNQTHIAISGEQMNMFPYLMADGYFKCDYNDRDEQLKKYFITQIPLYIYKDNVLYLADGEESGISFGDEKSRCVRASIVRSRRKEQADQVQLSLTTIDDPAFVSFRRLLHTGDYLVILKHKEKLVYDCIGIKANDETRGEFNISALNNKFYKLPTNTKVDIKELIEIKNAEIENKKFTVDELGTILKEMYGNAEDKMQVASIHIFGIKYGKNIIENEFKAPDIIKAAGLNESYSTELQKALNIYRCLNKNTYGISISEGDNVLEENKESVYILMLIIVYIVKRYQRFVYLDGIKVNLFDHVERRKSCTKIIYGCTYASFLESSYHAGHDLIILIILTFCELYLNIASVYPKSVYGTGYSFHQIAFFQMSSGKID